MCTEIVMRRRNKQFVNKDFKKSHLFHELFDSIQRKCLNYLLTNQTNSVLELNSPKEKLIDQMICLFLTQSCHMTNWNIVYTNDILLGKWSTFSNNPSSSSSSSSIQPTWLTCWRELKLTWQQWESKHPNTLHQTCQYLSRQVCQVWWHHFYPTVGFM